MNDFISRQAVIKTIERANGALYWNKTLMENLVLAVKAIPTIDAVPVVRCEDCKYMTEHYDTDGNVPYWTCSQWDSGTDYDGFCHYAERSEE